MHYSYEHFSEHLGRKVTTLRKEHGWSTRDMAMHHGAQNMDWDGLERGENLSVPSLLRVCEVFGVTMSQLVSGLGEEGRPRLSA